ncbi:MAG: glycosyl transferase family 2 [Ilumatobacteraceae bacterium]|jgi:GT2 family glycosyltransferase|nr:glycosyl transferase family 2 [Ilumatobacteraceae bacterium]
MSEDLTNDAPTSPAVSVVIPTYNRCDRLIRVLTALAAQRDDALFEVVVVSDGCTDGTDEYLRGKTTPMPVVAVFQENAGPAEARNRGTEAASGRLVLFIDDDVVPEPGLVAAHVKAHGVHGDDVVVIGPMLTPADADLTPWIRWEQAMLDKQYALLAELPNAHYRNFYTGNASISRSRIRDVGGFDSRFRRAEDVELAYRLDRAGLRFVFEPGARSLHYAERSFESWINNAYAYGRNDIVFGREGQTDVFGAIVFNFWNRHPLQRTVVLAALPRPRLAKAMTWALRRVALVAHRAHLARATRQALSGLYGIRYHQGVADELGGADDALELLHTGRRMMAEAAADKAKVS